MKFEEVEEYLKKYSINERVYDAVGVLQLLKAILQNIGTHFTQYDFEEYWEVIDEREKETMKALLMRKVSQKTIGPEKVEIVFPEYNYPGFGFEFNSQVEKSFSSYRELEAEFRSQLFSSSLEQIKDGLSNVLYWGFYRAGYRDVRVQKFRNKVTNDQLRKFRDLVVNKSYTPIEIKKLKMPQFSGFAFISKVMMFLDPTNYVTLDKKIMDLKDSNFLENPLTKIKFSEHETMIRITKESQSYYFSWCNMCKEIAAKQFPGKIAVDIERGFFRLVETGQIDYGRQIIKSQTKKNNANTRYA